MAPTIALNGKLLQLAAVYLSSQEIQRILNGIHHLKSCFIFLFHIIQILSCFDKRYPVLLVLLLLSKLQKLSSQVFAVGAHFGKMCPLISHNIKWNKWCVKQSKQCRIMTSTELWPGFKTPRIQDLSRFFGWNGTMGETVGWPPTMFMLET